MRSMSCRNHQRSSLVNLGTVGESANLPMNFFHQPRVPTACRCPPNLRCARYEKSRHPNGQVSAPSGECGTP
jgi:hypothetical protein